MTVARVTGPLAAGLLARLDSLTDAVTARIFTGIPGYVSEADDEEFAADVREHVERHIREVLEGFAADRAVVRDEFRLIRSRAMRRVGRISAGDYMMAFQTAHIMLLEELVPLAVDAESRTEAGRLA